MTEMSTRGVRNAPAHIQDLGVRHNRSTQRRERALVCVGMDANHTPHERRYKVTERRYTVNEAAELLGISAEAVRARINRCTLAKEKDADGTVYVRLDAAHTHTDGRPDGDATGDHTLAESKAFELMQEQVDYLCQQLEVWQEEARRKDHIIAALTDRIPKLEAPASATEPRESPQRPSEEGEGPVPDDGERPSWWRRFFEFGE